LDSNSLRYKKQGVCFFYHRLHLKPSSADHMAVIDGGHSSTRARRAEKTLKLRPKYCWQIKPSVAERWTPAVAVCRVRVKPGVIQPTSGLDVTPTRDVTTGLIVEMACKANSPSHLVVKQDAFNIAC
jgi:hypothetical protein